MNQKQKGAHFGFADGFMPDGAPVYIQTRPGASPSCLQPQIYAQLTEVMLDESKLRPQMLVHPWDPESVESMFSDLNTGLDRKELFADSHIMSREEILAKIAVKE